GLQRGLDEFETWLQADRREVALFHLARIVRGEAVQSSHRGALVEQGVTEVRSDEAGGAGDERNHANASRTRDGNRHGRPFTSTAACTVRPRAASVPSAFVIA